MGLRLAKLIIFGLPFLLASPATFAADLAIPQTFSTAGPGYTLTATAGAVAFSLPAQGTGVINSGAGTFDPSTSPTAFGLEGGVGGSIDIGKAGDLTLSLGFNAFGEFATSSDTATDTYTGPGTVIIPGYTMPVGKITLTNSGAPSASSIITGTGGIAVTDQNVHTTGGTPPADLLGVKQPAGLNTFGLGIASLGPNGASYGALASTAGGIFVGTGDLTGLKITTIESQRVVYTGADINLAATGDLSDGVTLQGYAGPSFRYLNQHNTIKTSVTPPAATVGTSGLVMPTYADIRTEDLISNYFGALGGLNLTTKVSETMHLTLGGQLGLYDMWSTFSGSEAYTISGGANAKGLPLTSQTVNNANTVSGSSNGTAYSAGLNAALTLAMTNTMDISLGGMAQYLSAVPVMNRAGSVSTVTGTGGANATYTGTGTATPAVGFASMWNYGGTVSVTGHF